MKQYKTALFIGRFQPFHLGHLYSLKKALEVARRVVVGIGSSEERGTESNPWSYEVRRQMVEAVVAGERVGTRVIKIVGIPDRESDSEWVREVVERVGEIDVVVSNNEWTLEAMMAGGYDTYQSGLYRREELEGIKIRAMMRAGDGRWGERVPEGVGELLEVVDKKV